MTSQEKAERALYEELFVRRGIVKSFDDALRHSAGEPLEIYGSDIPRLAAAVVDALDGGRDD